MARQQSPGRRRAPSAPKPDPWALNGPSWDERSPAATPAPARKRGRPGPTEDQVAALRGQTAAFTTSVNAFVAAENARRRLRVPRVRKITFSDLSVAVLGGAARPQPWSDLSCGREYLSPGRLVNAARAARAELGWSAPDFAYLTQAGIDEAGRDAAIYDDALRLQLDEEASEAQFKQLADWLVQRHRWSYTQLRAALEEAIVDHARHEREQGARIREAMKAIASEECWNAGSASGRQKSGRDRSR